MTTRLSVIAAVIVAMALVVMAMRDDHDAGVVAPSAPSVAIASRELAAAATWVGADTAGSLVVVVSGRDAEFVGGVPVPIDVISHTVDCAALGRVADFWRAHGGQAARAYVAAAQERAGALGCPRPTAATAG